MPYDIKQISGLGFSESELVTWRSSLRQEVLSAGGAQAVSSINTPGLALTFNNPVSSTDLLSGINYALWRKNPTLYPEGRLVTSQVAVFV